MIRRPIDSLEEFFAHAIAIEREAAQRYREFERHFEAEGEEVLAGLCRNLAGHEAQHLAEMLEQAKPLDLPAVGGEDYRWLDGRSPEAPPLEHFYSVATPRDLLQLALRAEIGAQFFYAWAAGTTSNPQVRELAREMRADEAQHVAWLEKAMGYRAATTSVAV